MLLSQADCLRLCEKPAYAADLVAGRALERRHRLHLDGDKALLREFLIENKPELLVSADSFALLEQIARPATKTLYAGYTNVLGKVFTAQGRNFYYQFKRPELAVQFDEFLKDTTREGQSVYGRFRSVWFWAMLTGFQGVMLVDLPAELSPTPAPYFRYVPSAQIWDMDTQGVKLRYLILQEQGEELGETKFYCFDDQQCHKVLLKQGSYAYLEQELVTHGLGFVPACPVTTRQANALKPHVRTSPVDESLELADVYLRDFNGHEFSKYHHIFQKVWTYGVRCENAVPAGWQGYEFPQTCTEGRFYVGDGSRTVACGTCKGVGRVVPVGPDKAYVVEVPNSKDESSLIPPAGYITPELASAEYIGKELVVSEAKIERAVLGKSGILEMQQKQQTLGGQIIDLEPLNDRLAQIAEDGEFVFKFITDTMARYQHGPLFEQSAVTLGRKWQLKSVGQLEAEYDTAKKAKLDDAILYSYLEDIVYTRYAGDPMELERNLLKLELTPAPTQTVDEAALAGVLSRRLLLYKTLINDFFNRFEREEGSILDFASLLSHGEKIKRIQAIFNTYLDEYAAEPAFTGGSQQNTADAGGNGSEGASEEEQAGSRTDQA